MSFSLKEIFSAELFYTSLLCLLSFFFSSLPLLLLTSLPSFSSSLSLPHFPSPHPPFPPFFPFPFSPPLLPPSFAFCLPRLCAFVKSCFVRNGLFFLEGGRGGGVTGYKGHCISFLCVSVICLPSGGGLRRFGFGRSR